MPHASPKEVAIQWFEQVWNATDKTAIARLLAPEGIGYLEGGLVVRGEAEFNAFHDQLLAGIPDLKIRILRAVGDDTQACVHWEATGTHKGNLMGAEASHRPLQFTGMSFMHVRDGRILEGWDSWNQGAVMAALTAPA